MSFDPVFSYIEGDSKRYKIHVLNIFTFLHQRKLPSTDKVWGYFDVPNHMFGKIDDDSITTYAYYGKYENTLQTSPFENFSLAENKEHEKTRNGYVKKPLESWVLDNLLKTNKIALLKWTSTNIDYKLVSGAERTDRVGYNYRTDREYSKYTPVYLDVEEQYFATLRMVLE